MAPDDERAALCALPPGPGPYGAATKAAEEGSEPVSPVVSGHAQRLRNLVLTQFFVMFVSLSVMGPFLPLEAVKRHISQRALGAVYVATPLTVALLSPAAGWFCATVGGPRALLTGALFMAAGSAFLAALPAIASTVPRAFSALLFGRSVIGAGMALGTNAAVTTLAPVFPDTMGMVNGQLETCAGVGYAVGTSLGGFLYGVGGWSLPFTAVAGIQCLSGLCLAACVDVRQSETATSPEGAGTDGATPTGALSAAKAPVWEPLLTSAYLFPTATVFLAALALSAPAPLLPVFWASKGLSVEVIGALQATMAIMYAVSCLVWGYFSEKVNPHLLAASGLFVTGLGYRLIANPSVLVSGIAFASWGALGSCLIVPTMPALLAAVRHGRLKTVGLAVGVEEAAYFCGEVVGPMVGVWAQSMMGFPTTIARLSLLMLVSGICYLAWVGYSHAMGRMRLW